MKDKRIIKGLYLSDAKKWTELENKINKEKVIELQLKTYNKILISTGKFYSKNNYIFDTRIIKV